MAGDVPFAGLRMASPARIALDNLRPSRARASVSRTLRREELEERLDRLARIRGPEALNDLRDQARVIAPALDAHAQFVRLDELVGALLGTRDADLRTSAGRARRAGLPYDTERLALFETLRRELATETFAERAAPPDPRRLFAFFEAYFSNWIEGTVFEVEEGRGHRLRRPRAAAAPGRRPRHLGTFDAVTDARLGEVAPDDEDALEDYLRAAHRRIMGGRPAAVPGGYKERANRAGLTFFVHPDEVRGTLREGFSLLATLLPGLPRAVFAMFLVAEVHPFTDGNGRVARLLMNAELSAAGLCRVMVPPVYRDEYLAALRALSQNGNPTPVWRMLDRAQRWAALMPWTSRGRVLELMKQTNALATPEEAAADNLHLRDPSAPDLSQT